MNDRISDMKNWLDERGVSTKSELFDLMQMRLDDAKRMELEYPDISASLLEELTVLSVLINVYPR